MNFQEFNFHKLNKQQVNNVSYEEALHITFLNVIYNTKKNSASTVEVDKFLQLYIIA